MKQLKYALLTIWDFAVFIVKSAVLFIVIVCVASMLGFTKTEEDTSIIFVAGLFASFIVCGKTYRKKRISRKLQYTNEEIKRLEDELAELTSEEKPPVYKRAARPSNAIPDDLAQFIHKAQWYTSAKDKDE